MDINANNTALSCTQTDVEDIPGAMIAFQGRLLVGIGKALRIYDLGKKKLLRKCENKVRSKQHDGIDDICLLALLCVQSFPVFIKSIHTQGDRIVIGDIAESFHFIKYRRLENQVCLIPQ